MAKKDKVAGGKLTNAQKIGLGLAGVLLLVLIVAISQNSSGASQTSPQNNGANAQCRSVPYTDESCNNVPYTDQEAYYEQECQNVPYTDQECQNQNLVYRKSDISCTREGLIGDWSVSQCTITNLDSQGGTFQVAVGVIVDGNQVGETQSKYIYPQSSETYKYSVKADASACYCSETSIPTKQVCRDVTKYRQECQTVTKYRPVTKYRQECTPVTKYRQEC